MAQEKKEYQKPSLERLVLIPRENVLAACHSIVTGAGDQYNPSCQAGVGGGCYGPSGVGPYIQSP
jgi:hypothetical protein